MRTRFGSLEASGGQSFLAMINVNDRNGLTVNKKTKRHISLFSTISERQMKCGFANISRLATAQTFLTENVQKH